MIELEEFDADNGNRSGGTNDVLVATVPQSSSGNTLSWTGSVDTRDGDNVAKVIAVDD